MSYLVVSGVIEWVEENKATRWGEDRALRGRLHFMSLIWDSHNALHDTFGKFILYFFHALMVFHFLLPLLSSKVAQSAAWIKNFHWANLDENCFLSFLCNLSLLSWVSSLKAIWSRNQRRVRISFSVQGVDEVKRKVRKWKRLGSDGHSQCHRNFLDKFPFWTFVKVLRLMS